MSISEPEKKEISFKMLIIGDSQVGKTSLLLKYVDDIFPESHISTIGIEFRDKILIKDDYSITLHIWDSAGQERFRSITKNIYRNTNGVLFVYDITNKVTFRNIKNWIKDTENIDKEIKGVIIGNKIDLEDKREITKEEIQELGNKYNMPVMECSAKNNIGIEKGFELLVDELLKDKDEEEILDKYSQKSKPDLSMSMSLSTKKLTNKKIGCCAEKNNKISEFL